MTPYSGQWFGSYNGQWLGEVQAGTCYYGDYNGITCGDWFGPTGGGSTPPVPPTPTPGAIGGARARERGRAGAYTPDYPDYPERSRRKRRRAEERLGAGFESLAIVRDRIEVTPVDTVPVLFAGDGIAPAFVDGMTTILPVDTDASRAAELAEAKRKQKQRNNQLALLIILAAR
jgi:hypothetical protein